MARPAHAADCSPRARRWRREVSGPALAALALALSALAADSAAARPLLADLFSDHAVLQRGRPIAVWGWAEPGEAVTVALAGAEARAVADAQGRWSATLPALPAGGPHELSARAASGAAETAADVLVGDVWLCSGQSNMAFPVSLARDAAREIAEAADDEVRLLTISQRAAPAPLDALPDPVAWKPAAPETVRGFSAACWFMARDLRKTVDVPMGLINSSWGGSAIAAWIGADGLHALGGYDAPLDILATYRVDPAAANARLGAAWEDWWRSRAPADPEPWAAAAGAGADWRPAPEPMRDWKTWGEPALAAHDGMVWFRRTVTLTAAQARQAATLSLGAIDEVDETWLNGTPVANTFGYGTERSYALPAGALREGENVIVLNVLSTYGAGGMTGPADRLALTFADGSSVPLGGGWLYEIAPLELGRPPRSPWEAVEGLGSLKNAMIAPFAPYGLAGVAWYQGESNTEDGKAYEGLLGALMADWRASFGRVDLPFLIVQLPNFGAEPAGPVESGWADVRESMRRAVEKDPHAALVVTIDVGDPSNLHPPDKQSVGARLARAARHVVYGESMAPSGPRVAGARAVEGGVEVTFTDVEGVLAGEPAGFELCGPSAGSCRPAAARLDGARALLDGTGARVRYCWGDAPVCHVADASGLPAGPFEVEVK